jgi:MoxR-like ATPase
VSTRSDQGHRLVADQTSRSQQRDDKGRPLFRSPKGNPTIAPRGVAQASRAGEPLFLAPQRASRQNDYDYADEHVKDRTNGGKGFTRGELQKLFINVTPGNYRNTVFTQWAGAAVYLAEPSNWLPAEVDLPALMIPTPHKASYVATRLAEMDEVRRMVSAYQVKLEKHAASLRDAIQSHLWVTPDFAEPASASLDGTRHVVAVLSGRVEVLRKGFDNLHREPEDEPLLDDPESDPDDGGEES